MASSELTANSLSRPRSSRAVAHIRALSTQVQGRDLARQRTMSLFHEVHNVLPMLPPVTTFALVELLRQHDIFALRELQFARVEWFQPVPDAVGERGVGRDALRDGLAALII